VVTLTKFRYLYGLQCLKRLWIDEHAPERLAPASPGEQRIMEQGIEVGKKARECFPGGILIDIQDFDSAARQTQQLIRGGAACVFEAAFILDDLRVRCDVLQRQRDNSCRIVEFKSSLKVKEENLPNLAFQHHVLSKSGVPSPGSKFCTLTQNASTPTCRIYTGQRTSHRRWSPCMKRQPGTLIHLYAPSIGMRNQKF